MKIKFSNLENSSLIFISANSEASIPRLMKPRYLSYSDILLISI